MEWLVPGTGPDDMVCDLSLSALIYNKLLLYKNTLKPKRLTPVSKRFSLNEGTLERVPFVFFPISSLESVLIKPLVTITLKLTRTPPIKYLHCIRFYNFLLNT